MMTKIVRALGLVGVVVLCAVPPAAGAPATQVNYVEEIPTPTSTAVSAQEKSDIVDLIKIGIRPPVGFPFPMTPLDPRVVWKDTWLCRFQAPAIGGPAEVTGFRVGCAGGTFLDFHIADCCIPGDHYELKGKTWDLKPNTGVTTSPGPVPVYSVPGRVYNYGGTAFNNGIEAYVECTYLHGVNVFPADSFVIFSSDGVCAVTPDPPRRRINRTP
jgi:hypothetical protein